MGSFYFAVGIKYKAICFIVVGGSGSILIYIFFKYMEKFQDLCNLYMRYPTIIIIYDDAGKIQKSFKKIIYKIESDI